MPDLILRVDQLENFRSRMPGLETDAAFAERIGLHPGQVSRVLNDDSHRKFGKRFIAGILDVFGIEFFADLFTIIPDDNGAST